MDRSRFSGRGTRRRPRETARRSAYRAQASASSSRILSARTFRLQGARSSCDWSTTTKPALLGRHRLIRTDKALGQADPREQGEVVA